MVLNMCCFNDVKNKKFNLNYEVYLENGKKPSGIDLNSWIETVQIRGTILLILLIMTEMWAII